MANVIGVEQSLTNVEQALRAKGYEVVQLRTEQDAKNCDVCVITGQDEDMMGMNDIVTAGPVINASGLSAEDVVQRVDKFLS